jgi:hypothetical protein
MMHYPTDQKIEADSLAGYTLECHSNPSRDRGCPILRNEHYFHVLIGQEQSHPGYRGTM